LRAGAEEEGHVDRDKQILPLSIVYSEISEVQCASGHTFVPGASHAIEQGRAGLARANDLSLGNLNQVRVLVRNRGAAKLALFLWAPRPGKPAECGKRRRSRYCRHA
jgi:hypothetical protein